MLKSSFTALLLSFCTIFTLNAQCDFNSDIDGNTCESAVFLCNNLIDGYVGVLPDTTTDIQFPQLCTSGGSIENPVWFSFVACQSTVSINIIPTNCTVEPSGFTGIQAAIYSTCSFDQSVACFDDGSDVLVSLSYNNFIPGQLYYLIIDGMGGSVCQFEIDVIEGISNETPIIESTGTNEISGVQGAICTSSDKIYSYEVPDCQVLSNTCDIPFLSENDWVCYNWVVSGPVTFYGESDTPIIDISFDNEGTYTISVERILHPYLLSCTQGSCDDPPSIVVEVSFLDTVMNTTTICPGEFIEVCGELVGAPGVYECLDDSNCLMIIDTIKMGTGDVQNQGVIYLCPGECYSLENIDYCDRQDYLVQSTIDCSIVYQFSIKDLSININAPVYPEINCNNSEVQVSHNVNTNYNGNISFRYENAAGQAISTNNFANISEPGDYIFIVYSTEIGESCGDTISFTIKGNYDKPVFSINAENITCLDKEADLEVVSTDNLVGFSWKGPSAGSLLTDDEQVVQAVKSGLYHVTVTGENGCTEVSSIEVTKDFPPAEIDIMWDDLDCNIAQTTLSYLTDITVDSILWTGPDEFRESNPNALIEKAGVYVLNLYASSGCDYAEIFEVLGKYQEPEIEKLPTPEWACKTESLQIEIDYSDTSDFSLNWFTNSGLIISSNNNKILEVGSVGQYFVETTNNITGCTKIDTLEVFANDQVPTFMEIDAINPLCFGIDDGKIEIIEVQGGNGPFLYELDGIPTGEIIENLAPAVYELTAIDANGCEIKREIPIEAPNELSAEMEGPIEGLFEEVINFKALIPDMTNVVEINWYNESNVWLGSGVTMNFLLIKNTIIRMEVTDVNNCIVIRTAPVILDEDYDYYVPTIFTPNEDGVNDFFNIFPQDLPGVIKTFAVFDRWGNIVFQTSDIDHSEINSNWGWDGKYKGNRAAQGVYVYYALVETLGIEKELKGTVTLVR